MMSAIKIYIDKQNTVIRKKPYRLRVMQDSSEAIAIYFSSSVEAERAKKFTRKIVTALHVNCKR